MLPHPRHRARSLPLVLVMALAACAGPKELRPEQMAGVFGHSDERLSLFGITLGQRMSDVRTRYKCSTDVTDSWACWVERIRDRVTVRTHNGTVVGVSYAFRFGRRDDMCADASIVEAALAHSNGASAFELGGPCRREATPPGRHCTVWVVRDDALELEVEPFVHDDSLAYLVGSIGAPNPTWRTHTCAD